MEFSNRNNRLKKISIGLLLIIFNLSFLGGGVRTAQAAYNNLLKDGSFESDFDTNWNNWSANDRTYEIFRSYQVPYGYGSYSLGITAEGEAEDLFSAGMVSDGAENGFSVEAGKIYSLVFYAKASSEVRMSAFVERAIDYQAITSVEVINVGTNWQKYSVNFVPEESGAALLAFVYGELEDSQTLYIDGLSLYEQNAKVEEELIRGDIGDENKLLEIDNLPPGNKYDIEIELPYYDGYGQEVTRKRFNPTSVSDNGVYLNIFENTFSGIGRVYAYGGLIGEFEYRVNSELKDFYPSIVRANEDLTITGSGFNPSPKQTFVIVKKVDVDGEYHEEWLEPHIIDSKLEQIVVKMPLGIKSDRMYVYTSYTGLDGSDVVDKSSYLYYKVKPAIYRVAWSQRGFEHVGDKIVIAGKGISNRPTVNFYDEAGNKIDSNRAEVIKIGDGEELIEVEATDKTNKFTITVECGSIESDKASAIDFVAKPKLDEVEASHKREMYSSGEEIAAAKIGETIELSGAGLLPSTGNVVVEFQGQGTERIQVTVERANIDERGRDLSVVVPEGAVEGYLNIEVNGEKSNSLPLEIVPSVVSISPDPLVPGASMTIRANGVRNNIALTKVGFKLDKENVAKITPEQISINQDGSADIRLTAPRAISNSNTQINITYNHWESTGQVNVGVNPHISQASFDKDQKMLIIKGSGFSINPRENEITYRYADPEKTVIDPDVRVLGVYPNQDGQEIRVKINDDYHYGFVSVKVGDQLSNEANFGPVSIRRMVRRVEFVKSVGAEKGVIYINGYNFGPEGGVKVGPVWADIHYRSDFFIIAVVDKQYLWSDPVVVAKQ